jgi:glycosyltransferase involved in cell wall biosynthesis
VVWLEKELVPWAPALIERGLLRKLPYVADYDDAIFHNYDLHRNPILRALFRSKIAKVMCGAAVVVAGNRYIADRARAAGAENVQVVPTVVDEAKYGLRTCYPHGDRGVTVGWIGSPATQYLLEPVLPIIESVLELPRDRFVTIGTRFGAPLFRGHEERPWSEETEVSALAELDVGVMPLRDAPFERGKCGYKIIQYMASGCAVVASPVGANCDIVVEGETGFLAETAEQWSTALRTLKNDRDMRVRMAEAGRKRFEQRYSLRSAVPIVAEILRGAASGS